MAKRLNFIGLMSVPRSVLATVGTKCPMFAFVNAGVSLSGVSAETLLDGVPLGIMLGLVAGKALGIYGSSWLLFRRGAAHLPAGATRRQFLGICTLCGIGFTMSLFIGTLAFELASYAAPVRLGVLAGSALSGIAGYLVLRMTSTTLVTARGTA